jgi:hypothetical protein
MAKHTQRRRHRRKHVSRKYRGGNPPTLPVFAPKNLNSLPTQSTINMPTTQSIKMPPLTSNMAVIEHNQPSMYDVCGNKSTIEHIGDSVQQIAAHPSVVGAKNAVLGAMSGVLPGAKKMLGLEGGKMRRRNHKHSLHKRKSKSSRKHMKKSKRASKK